ncbi:MAG TPA: roadblock/LC7 domain-containing protein, partial [Methanomicrobiales archaeon]|nr:roadblock/LC7 domain-containing protein [Methanomicrobiales archaeon]
RESSKAEKPPAEPKAGEVPIKPAIPEIPEPVRAADSAVPQILREEPAVEEKVPFAPPAPAGGTIPLPEGAGPEGRVKVDLGKMMKRIKRLDITSIREELEAGAEGSAGLSGEAAPEVPAISEAAEAPAQQAETRGKSDIDELKAFIQRLEVLEAPPEETPSLEKGIFAKLGIRTQPEEAPAPPKKREVPLPISRRPKAPVEPAAEEEARPPPAPVEERPAPQPPEPDRKAKITSLLRRSGLVKPPVEEQPREPVPEIEPEPVVHREREEAPALPAEAEVRAPRPQRKKVEITRVPKMPERAPREPPLVDERMLQRILKQPGVIAVSTFFEGFAVQSAGKADFEQVAANAEDLFRAGKKIAREIELGPLNQIILETGRGKLVIAPYGDLNVCIFTEPDANLGLIRVAIRGMQLEKD